MEDRKLGALVVEGSAETIGGAAEILTRRGIRAGRREWRRRSGAIEDEVSEKLHRIGDVERALIIDVARIHALGRGKPSKDVGEEKVRIRDRHSSVRVGVPANEVDRAKPRGRAEDEERIEKG